MKFISKKVRMRHPYARKIPDFIWEKLFNDELTEFQLSLVQKPVDELSKFLAAHPQETVTLEQKYPCFILLLICARIPDELLLDLALQLGLDLLPIFVFGTIRNISFIKHVAAFDPKADVMSMLCYDNWLALKFAIALSNLPVLEYFFTLAPLELTSNIATDDYLWLQIALHRNVLEFLGGQYAKAFLKQTKEGISILTDAPFKTYGDVSAAAKLIRSLKSRLPMQKITWIIREDDGAVDIKDLIPEDINVRIISSWNDVYEKEDSIIDLLGNSYKVIAFPTFHYLPITLVKIINVLSKLISVTEYDCEEDEKLHIHGMAKYTTGLGKGALGVFFSEKPEFIPLYRGVPPFPVDINIEQHNNSISNRVFFGYTNNAVNQCINGVTPELFILTCMQLIPKGDICILVRLDPAQNDLIKRLICEIEPHTLFKIYQSKDKFYTSFPEINFLCNTRIVTLYNPFPMGHKDMSRLLCYSNQFCLVTGDQSLSEALSFDKLPLYQCMIWKGKFFGNLIDKSQTVGAELYEFFIRHYSNSRTPKFCYYPEKDLIKHSKALAKFLLTNQHILSTQVSTFSELIRTRYNVADALSTICAERAPNSYHSLRSMTLFANKEKRKSDEIEGEEPLYHSAAKKIKNN